MSDLVIVSNRGPFSFSEEFLIEAEECLETGRKPPPLSFGEGGLVQAMAGLLKRGRWNPTWIGASMGNRDIEVARGHYTPIFTKLERENLAPLHFPHIEIEPDERMRFRYQDYDFYMRFVFFDTKHMHSYYSKFANGFLWPLMHLTRSPLFYKKTKTYPRPHFEKSDFIQYTSSGVSFGDTVMDEIRKSEQKLERRSIVVWNQDYHLMQIAEVYRALLLEGGFSKDLGGKIHVGHFMHTPFFDIHEIQGLIREDKRSRLKAQRYDPFGESIESVLQKLTWGLLANDFIGFQTKECCDNYLEALQEWFPVQIRVVGGFYEIAHQDRVTTVGQFPIGLDVDRILKEVSENLVLDAETDRGSLRENIDDQRKKGALIFGGLERCDYTKGLVERLSIFYYAANRLRSSGVQSRFYQITAPSRNENPDYQNLQAILDLEVSSVNRRLGGEHVLHFSEGISVPQNYRFMKQVDVMFVTPLEDGMNLVAFEYILSQKFREPEERGILALGPSGASRVLKECGFGEEDGIVHVNPMKPREAGEKLAEAVAKKRHISGRVIEYIERERRVDNWAEENIEAILECRKTP